MSPRGKTSQAMSNYFPPISDSDSLDNPVLLPRHTFNHCCCSCARAMVYTANLSISTAFSNRFLQEISQKDPVMDEVSSVLEKLASSQHYFASKLINHIISHGWHYENHDPGKPSWRVDPSEVVLNGNKDLVEDIKNILEKLKSHNHSMERNLIKKYLRRAKLPQLWDQLDKLLKIEVSELVKNSNIGSDLDSTIVSGRDSEESSSSIEHKEAEAANDQEDAYKENKVTGNIFKDEGKINEIFQSVKITNAKNLKKTNKIEESKSDTSQYNDKKGKKYIEKHDDEENNQSTGKYESRQCKMKDCGYISSSLDDEINETDVSSKPGKSNDDSINAGKSAVLKKENDEEDGKSNYTISWEKMEEKRKKVVFLVCERSSWSSCGSEVTSLILGLVNWLDKQGVLVLVPREDLQSKELSEHKEFKKLSAWAGDLSQLASEVDLIVCLGGDGSMLRVSHMFQGSMPPVMGFGVGGRNALYCQSWEEEEARQMILRCLLGEQEMSVILRARLVVTITNSGDEPITAMALNEVTVLRGLCPCLAKIEVMLDKTLLYQLEGDGVMVSTPTGSSAYSLSARGPLVSPSLSCMLLTPVACLSIQPSVIPASSTVVLIPSPSGRADNLPVDVDGRVVGELRKNGKVVVTMSRNDFPQVMDMDINSYWGEMVRRMASK